jgi:hypothetical protein
VFISSTSEDLEPYWIAARDATILAGCHPVMMEYLTPQGERRPYTACMREVDACDVVIAIVAHRYGWVPKDQPDAGERSITWLDRVYTSHNTHVLRAEAVDHSVSGSR